MVLNHHGSTNPQFGPSDVGSGGEDRAIMSFRKCLVEQKGEGISY